MPAAAGGASNNIRILLELLIGHRRIASDGIVRGVDHQQGNPYSQHTIRTTTISVVLALCSIAPGLTLDLTVEFLQILQTMYSFPSDQLILPDLFVMCLKQGEHTLAHGLAVDLTTDPGALQVCIADFEFPGAAHDHGCRE